MDVLLWLLVVPACSVILLSAFWTIEVLYKKITGKNKDNKTSELVATEKGLDDFQELFKIGIEYVEWIKKGEKTKFSKRVSDASPNQIRAGLIIVFTRLLQNEDDWDQQRKVADSCARIFYGLPSMILGESDFTKEPEPKEMQDRGNEVWDAYINCILTKEKTAFILDDSRIISEVLSKLPHQIINQP